MVTQVIEDISLVEVNLVVKYSLFLLNVVVWIVGIFLLVLGIWAFSEKGVFDQIVALGFIPLDPVIFLIVFAIVIICISFLGCLGALRENLTFLHYFSAALGIIIVLEILLVVLGYSYQQTLSQKFYSFINTTIENYRRDPDLQNLIDFAQSYFECCGGADGPNDWENNLYFNCSTRIHLNGFVYRPQEACGVPYSCCVPVYDSSSLMIRDTQCGYGTRDPEVSIVVRAERIYTTGCVRAFDDWIKIHSRTVFGVLIGLALCQIIPLMFAQNLMVDIGKILSVSESAMGHSLPQQKNRLRV